MDDYYKKIFYLAQVDKSDCPVGKVERWEAHQKGILHRGFTAILIVENKVIFQKRRHPVFDGYWDISFSSHPIYENDQLQDNKDAILRTLKREWIIKETIKKEEIKYLEKFYYKAKDEQSGLIEHEIDYLYKLDLNFMPNFNRDYAYEIKAIDKDLLKDKNSLKKISKEIKLAPWVKIDDYQRLLT